MADTTTELEVLDQIVDVLGGQSGQYETVVPTLQQILALLGGGGGGSGYNPALSVGRADALTGADTTAQWATRESTGSGAATVRSVQGAAVVWNQLVPLFSDSAKWLAAGVAVTTSDNGRTVNLAASTNMSTAKRIYISSMTGNVPLHVYAITGIVDSTHLTEAAALFGFFKSGESSDTLRILVNAGQPAQRYTMLGTPTGPYNFGVRLGNTAASGEYAIFKDVQLFDLTAMFGSGNEPATVEEFEAMYPESYYPYSAPTLKPVQIAGIASTDAQGNALDSVEWTAQTLRAAGSVRDMLYSDHVDVNVGSAVIDGSTPIWVSSSSGTYVRFGISTIPNAIGRIEADTAKWVSTLQALDATPNGICSTATPNRVYFTLTENETTVELAKQYLAAHPIHIFYPLATPTTTPISPALPMTYRVQAGGSESIIVPNGEISAIPVLTIAEGESVADVVMDALACIATPDGPVATANHSVGTYLTMQGKLYKVTSAIAVGETIAAGTNVTQTTVMAELLALTA